MTPDQSFPSDVQASLDAERLVSAVAHDLKAPLVTIQGFLSGLESAARNGQWEEFQTDTQRIHATCERMRRILDDLRELARQAEPVRQTTPVDLNRALQEAREQVLGFCPRDLQFVNESPLPTVSGDFWRLTRVFQNVLENACRSVAQQPNPRIVVTWQTANQLVTVSIADNGMGLDPAEIPRLFEPFRQLGARTGDSGLGMSIAQRIVHAHGGNLALTSPGIGQGATAVITLPAGTVS